MSPVKSQWRIAVAASSAFPVLFEPVPIDHTRLRCKEELFDKTEYLTDGGVFENLGLWMLRHLHKIGELSPGCISLVSDAQLPFDWERKSPLRHSFSHGPPGQPTF